MPLGKLYTAKVAVAQVSEGLECFGGQGYMEDTQIARGLRDTQVLPIWEGTTNIIALDVLRVLLKRPAAYEALVRTANQSLQTARQIPSLAKHVDETLAKLDRLSSIITEQPAELELGAREFAFTLSNVFIAATLAEVAVKSKLAEDAALARKFFETRDLCPFLTGHANQRFTGENRAEEQKLVFEK